LADLHHKTPNELESAEPGQAGGALYVVGTPIGNLGDLTLRAIETLRSVDRVAAEDTRRTRALLSYLDIQGKRLQKLDAYAEEHHLAEFVEAISRGERVALVTDAGMPSISDPGAALIRATAERDLPIRVVPGPSAVTAAVAMSGLADGPFLFMAFLPRQGQKRRAALARIATSPEPVVLFESPTRATRTLRELALSMPDRLSAVSRELTKFHEETHRGTLRELAKHNAWRGEITIVIASAGKHALQPNAPQSLPDDQQIDARIARALTRGESTKSVAARLHGWSGRPRRELYARVQASRERLNRNS